MRNAYRNISVAAASSFSDLLAAGRPVRVRSSDTVELLNRVTALDRPFERFLFLPGRLHDVFAQIAETLWVLRGRDDIDWLARYLPRARDFSDDGKTWRAAYGPRLRRWHGEVDQIARVLGLLREDRTSRRAVMSLFDPQLDFTESRDIPCNNWLSWLVRDDVLHLNVALRSNDALWGFSGTNAFEWSLLHELMAGWTDTKVGALTFFATSFHLYTERAEQARNVVARFHGISPYDFGVAATPITIPWDRLDQELDAWFRSEEAARTDPEVTPAYISQDLFLSTALQLVRLRWGAEAWGDARLGSELAALPETDMTAAAYEHFGRKRPVLLEGITQPSIAAFFSACAVASSVPPSTEHSFGNAIKRLHTRKDRAYAGAWKRRGERLSVLPNVARKVDRLEAFLVEGNEMPDETILDTAVDLYVYAQKYQILLAEAASTVVPPYAESGSHGPREVIFDTLVDRDDIRPGTEPVGVAINRIVSLFDNVWRRAEADAPVKERQELAASLAEAARLLLTSVAAAKPALVAFFVASEMTPGAPA